MRHRRRGRNSVAECSLPKADVVGSNPIARSLTPSSPMGFFVCQFRPHAAHAVGVVARFDDLHVTILVLPFRAASLQLLRQADDPRHQPNNRLAVADGCGPLARAIWRKTPPYRLSYGPYGLVVSAIRSSICSNVGRRPALPLSPAGAFPTALAASLLPPSAKQRLHRTWP